MSLPRRQSGFGLLEIILVIALVVVAASLAFVIFSSANPSAQSNTEATKLTTLASSIKGVYGINHDYSGVSNTTVIRGHMVPNDMTPAGNTTDINSLWGAVEVTPTSINGNANRGFQVVYRAVPVDACLKFVLGVAPYFPEGVAVGTGTSVSVLDTRHKVNMTIAIPACQPDGAQDVDVVFIGQ